MTTKGAKFEYMFYPARNSSYNRFKVKSKNDAYVMMSEYANPTDSQHYYEVRNHCSACISLSFLQKQNKKNSVVTSEIA